MNQSYAYISANILSLIMIAVTIIIVYKRNQTKGAKNLILILSLILIGNFCTFMEGNVLSFEAKHLWRNLSQIGLFLLPSSIYAFTIVYTNEKKAFFKKLVFVNFIFAIVSVLLIFTNDFHHIMRTSVELIEGSNGFSLKVHQTLIGKVFVTLNTLISLISLIKIWIFMKTRSKNMKNQVRLVFIGFLIPIAYTYGKSAIVKITGFIIPGSTSFLIGIVLILIGMYKYDFMTISPIARDWVIDEIKMGMLFFDSDGNIVDTNKSAQQIFGMENKEITEKIKNKYPIWQQKLIDSEDTTIEVGIETKLRGYRNYGITIHPLKNKEKSLGIVNLMQDITNEVNERARLIDKSEKDSMTQIYNKIAFKRKVNEILTTNNDEYMKYSLLIIDIDNFKAVNDTYGHKVGDDVIIEVVKLANLLSREEDLVGRLGGDEFAIFLLNCDETLNEIIANRIQKSVAEHKFMIDDNEFYISLSIGGITDHSATIRFDDLYVKADKALYTAKKLGGKRFAQYKNR